MTRLEATVLEGDVPDTKGWYAWNDLMPPRPDEVHVIGEVLVANPGVDPELTYRIPQGINPAVLLLDLRLVQKAGIWPQVLTWKPVRYSAVLGSTPYTQAIVFYGTETVVGLDVDTVHLASVAGDTRGYRLTRSGTAGHHDEVPFPRRSGMGWSGENPFPWMSSRSFVCLSGSLSKVQFDFCMDGVRYQLTTPEGARVRVHGSNEVLMQKLEAFSEQRIVIVVCGRFHRSVENGCQYLLAETADPVRDFASRLAVIA